MQVSESIKKITSTWNKIVHPTVTCDHAKLQLTVSSAAIAICQPCGGRWKYVPDPRLS